MKKRDLHEVELFVHNVDGNPLFIKFGVKPGRFRVWPDKKYENNTTQILLDLDIRYLHRVDYIDKYLKKKYWFTFEDKKADKKHYFRCNTSENAKRLVNCMNHYISVLGPPSPRVVEQPKPQSNSTNSQTSIVVNIEDPNKGQNTTQTQFGMMPMMNPMMNPMMMNPMMMNPMMMQPNMMNPMMMNPNMGMNNGMNPNMGMNNGMMNPNMGMNNGMMNPNMGMNGMNPNMMNPNMGLNGMGNSTTDFNFNPNMMNPNMGMNNGMNPNMGMNNGLNGMGNSTTDFNFNPNMPYLSNTTTTTTGTSPPPYIGN
eukprot:TRINITY_DN655_c0_g1_i3.p1 TRINITY_DN655_c0_g1~~TRINITY_DN655_c0_g1_i3.p1  ORF type:complete len:323 (-),score=65.87 TRINITY_DN655_c0_g1_i3:58-990(-)